MKYNDIKLNALLRGITVRSPEGRSETAVIENLTKAYHMDNLRPILYGLEKAGIKNIVIDLSKFPPQSRGAWIAFLDSTIAISSGFNAKYTGITMDEAGSKEPSFMKYISPKIAGNLEEAVNSF